jgi:hypothetical protein
MCLSKIKGFIPFYLYMGAEPSDESHESFTRWSWDQTLLKRQLSAN